MADTSLLLPDLSALVQSPADGGHFDKLTVHASLNDDASVYFSTLGEDHEGRKPCPYSSDIYATLLDLVFRCSDPSQCGAHAATDKYFLTISADKGCSLSGTMRPKGEKEDEETKDPKPHPFKWVQHRMKDGEWLFAVTRRTTTTVDQLLAELGPGLEEMMLPDETRQFRQACVKNGAVEEVCQGLPVPDATMVGVQSATIFSPMQSRPDLRWEGLKAWVWTQWKRGQRRVKRAARNASLQQRLPLSQHPMNDITRAASLDTEPTTGTAAAAYHGGCKKRRYQVAV